MGTDVIRTLILAFAAAAVAAGCATTTDPAVYQAQAVDLMKRDFHSNGIAKLEWLNQDELQKACSTYDGRLPPELGKRLEAAQLATIRYPADGNFMGDWKRGESIAQSGRGSTWTDQAGEPGGGSCYNCHQLAPQTTSFGTIGPSLRDFGKIRGFTSAIQKYAYERIYNSKAFNACSAMPRFGHAGALTEQQIKDLVALLMDPSSPVNK
jgi:sulfur-oxidizing protein SoxX